MKIMCELFLLYEYAIRVVKTTIEGPYVPYSKTTLELTFWLFGEDLALDFKG